MGILQRQPVLLKVRAPIKIFGSVHGAYLDMMRFFDLWKFPGETHLGGDIDGFDYLFLGNYVDEGVFSLEVVCLLMALKVKFPEQVYLLRGAHEDRRVNASKGFGEECSLRLGEDISDSGSVFAQVNEMFEWLPIAASLEGKVFCVHGGVAASTETKSIETISRPIVLTKEDEAP